MISVNLSFGDNYNSRNPEWIISSDEDGGMDTDQQIRRLLKLMQTDATPSLAAAKAA